MRVTAGSSPSIAATRRDGREHGSGGVFAGLVAAGGPPSPHAGIGTAAPLASLGALVALQVLEESGTRRRRLIHRGHGLLDRLEALKLALLQGEIPLTLLREIEHGLAERRDLGASIELEDVIAAIELRTAVELAKLESRES